MFAMVGGEGQLKNLARQTRLAPVVTLAVALLVAVAVAWPGSRASFRQSVAGVYNVSAQHEMAAQEILEALAQFDLPPR
jgi:hypothetical protein